MANKNNFVMNWSHKAGIPDSRIPDKPERKKESLTKPSKRRPRMYKSNRGTTTIYLKGTKYPVEDRRELEVRCTLNKAPSTTALYLHSLCPLLLSVGHQLTDHPPELGQ
eukprot:1195667-Prorocentrum_minimum.AAC.12